MHLKRLESMGFKSFADRINIEFVKGMTAVVGPNGSGKSNITDAIRWVLGEQSVKSLRGSKMEDIIFQGSDSRKPLNFAEVNLVLDNSNHALSIDYQEVSILRRVYRSGASEFYINKQACRLKDIIDLFMDSGLGQEAFSIISQGKVEEVLSSKAEERRTIFEEAAGVLKYKQRKKKAEYKLAETGENSNRVNDIIHEIDKQIKPLSKQAKKAEEYSELKEKLVEIEVSLFRTEIEDLHNEWEKHLSEFKKEQAEELNLKTEIQVKDAAIENKRSLLLNLDKSVEKFQEDLLMLTQQLEQYEGRKRVLKERLNHFSKNQQKTLHLKKETFEQKKMLKIKFATEQKVLDQLRNKSNETKDMITTLEGKLSTNIKELLAEIESKKNSYIEELNKQAVKRNDIKTINEQLQHLSEKALTQESKHKEINEYQKKLKNKKDALFLELTKTKEAFEQSQKQLITLKKELEGKRSQFETLQQILSQSYQKTAKLKSKKEMLEEMKEGFQGFFYGVKNILKARDAKELKYIHGAVIELIEIPLEYTQVIETALGAQSQHIVVLKKEQARETIAWLRKNNKGRATFLPLDSIQSRLLSKKTKSEIKKHPGYIEVAANLVSYKPLYKEIIQHLMGHIIVARNLKDANEIASLVNHRYRIVTLDGDVVNPGGSMSGGARNQSNQSLFTRDQDLHEVSKELEEAEDEVKKLKDKLTKEKQSIDILEEQISTQERHLYNLQLTLQELQSTYGQSEVELSSLKASLSEYARTKDQDKNNKDHLVERKYKLEKELTEIEKNLQLNQTLINRLIAEEENHKVNQDHIEAKVHQHQILFAEVIERIKNQTDKTKMIKNQLVEVESTYKKRVAELAEFTNLKKTQDQFHLLNKEINDKNNAKKEMMATIQSTRSQRLHTTSAIQDEERELKEMNEHLQMHLKMIQEKEVLINRLDVTLENKLLELEAKHRITYERARETHERLEDVEGSKFYVSELNEQIKKLGVVNLDAIEEYKRISVRHDFLMKQKEDLVEAKEILYSVIAELDKEMKERFETTFNQIKKEFTHVFIELFGGGKAELSLSHPENMLETGIDIVAQPPGKQLQHLGLLSGGERALTAIALLFAILRVRPVPFCVLDEVESALDEANVTRFAKYIKQHSEKTQFIIITHRKGTMEEADVLYGVTMQEPGVSRLVSVKLEDAAGFINE